MPRESVHHLVCEVALLIEARDIGAYGDRDAWMLACDEGAAIDIEYDGANDRIVVSLGIAEVAADARERMYELMLQYNYLWTETGGLRMALDGVPGQAVLMFEMPVPGLLPARLAGVLDNMAAVRRGWCHVLHSPDH